MPSLEQKVILREWGGQRSDVELHRRSDGSVYVTFTHEPGYGYASLELRDLRRVMEQAEQMASDAQKHGAR